MKLMLPFLKSTFRKLSLITLGIFLLNSNLTGQEVTDIIKKSTGTDYFGTPFVINNDWLFTLGGSSDNNSVFTYKKSGNQWREQQPIASSNTVIFGHAFDLDSTWAIISESGGSQAINFYKLEDGQWNYKQSHTKSFIEFGRSLAIHDNWAVASSPDRSSGDTNKVYLYEKMEDDFWQEKQVIHFDDAENETSNPKFGTQVLLNGQFLVVNAPRWVNAGIGNQYTGAVYIYKKENMSWVQMHRILTSQLAEVETFVTGINLRNTMALENNLLAINVSEDNDDGGTIRSVRLIEFDQNGWTEIANFDAGNQFTNFGESIDLTEDKLVIADPSFNDGTGKIYSYQKQENTWILFNEYVPSQSNQSLGRSLAYYSDAIYAAADPNQGEIQILGVKMPRITSITKGKGKSYTKIEWTNNSAIQDGFKIYRDGETIVTTSRNARSYFDYEGVPGKMHRYDITAIDNESLLESSPTWSYGYQQPNGIIEGKVQTPLGSGVGNVLVSIDVGDVNRSVYMDTVNQRISTVYYNFPDTALTISLWLKTDGGQNAALFDYFVSGIEDVFKIANPQNITVFINNDSIKTGLNIDDGSWHHLAVSWRNTDGQLKVYDMGELAFNQKFLAGDFITESGLANFGGDYNSGGAASSTGFKGWLDEFQLWNGVLGDTLVKEYMGKRLIGNEKNLITGYSFDDTERYPEGNTNYLDIVWETQNAVWSNDLQLVSDPGQVLKSYRKTYTSPSGKFSFKNVYYDEERTFDIIPFKENHGFAPGSEQISLSVDHSKDKTVSFDDTTSFTISGRLSYSTTNCYLEGAEIILDGQPTGVFSMADGSYQLTIENAGPHTIKPLFADSALTHSFRPAESKIDVNDNLFNIDFEDITTSRLYGRVGAACNTSLGVATLRISSLGNPGRCFVQSIDTDTDGNYSIDLPSQKYLIEVVSLPDNPQLLNEFRTLNVDLTFQDTLANFIYRNPPTIRISGLPDICTGAEAPFNVPVVAQYEQYFLTIEVIDSYLGDSCLVDTGTITIFDDIGGDSNNPITLKLSNGQAHYILVPGKPNIIGNPDDPSDKHPFQKLFYVTADIDGEFADANNWMVVTGHSPRTETFVTKTPELPLMILRDPPGDQSYSYLEKGTSTTTNFKMSHEIGGSAGAFLDLKIGAGIPVPFTGIIIGASTNIKASIMAGRENNNGTTLTTTISNSERFSTSGGDVTGEDGDVIMGVSFNLIYALTDIIDFDEEKCTVVQDTQLVWGSEEINTSYIYTENHIRNTLLPQLSLLQSLASPDSALLIGTYIDVWEQVLEKNARLKKQATKEKNISFSAGTTREFSTTTVQDSTISIDFTIFIDSEASVSVSVGDGGTFADTEFGVAAKFRWSRTEARDTTFQTSTTVGYVLGDDDPGDFFSVDIKHDTKYGTPVFDLISGTSSCPWEDGTQPRDGVQLSMDGYVRNDVPVGEKAAFILSIGNTSESGETRDYALSVIQASNLDGAIISVGGVVIEDALDYTIPAGEQITATLAVDRGPLAWDYENLKIRLYSPCDPSISDTISFSVHYKSPCSDINIFSPDDNWLVNASDNDTLNIILNEYTQTNADLETIKLEYRLTGGPWKTAFAIPKKDIPQQYITYSWNVRDLPNGQYELRAVARCGSGLSYSPILKGKIDRSALVVFGKPQPADGILNLGDDIKIAFTENLDCDAISENAVQVVDSNDNPIPVSVACSDKELIISLETSPDSLEGKLLTATVISVKDLSGNYLRNPVSWQFTINQNPLYWNSSNIGLTFYKGDEPTIGQTFNNAGGQSASYTLTSLPEWLETTALNGSIPAGGTKEISFQISDALNPGTYSDTLFAQTEKGDEPLFIEITILAQPPVWQVNIPSFTYSMNITAQLNIEGNPSDDTFDMISAFVGNSVRGVSNVQYVSDLYGYLAFITIYSNSPSGEQISFRGWDASEGNEYGKVGEQFVFQDGSELGSVSNPVILNPQGIAQNIDLAAGWTWISLNVEEADMSPNAVLENVNAQTGDIIKSQNEFAQFIEGSGWQGSLEKMETGKAYFIKLNNPAGLRFIGQKVDNSVETIFLDKGWNWIGYNQNRINGIDEALANLDAQNGDRIKSQGAFAEYNAQNDKWIGSLQYLKPGEGYLIKSNSATNFNYNGLNKTNVSQAIEGAPESWNFSASDYEYTMSLVAQPDFKNGSTLDSLDIVAAFVNGECRGVTNPVFIPALNRFQVFLTIFDNDARENEVTFKMLENESGIVYSAGSTVPFRSDSLAGSIIKPVILKAAFATNEGALPVQFKIYQNYPNPFNPSTTIRYELPTRVDVKVTVFNLLGQKVAVLVNEAQNAGRYKIDFDAASAGLSSGLYFYRIEAGKFTKVHKMLLVK